MLLTITSLSFFSPIALAQEGRFDDELEKGIQSIKSHVHTDIVTEKGTDGLITLVRQILQYLMPIFITLGTVIALFGGYKMMTSSKEDALKEGGQLVLYGVIGIIIMSSARFVANTLVLDVIDIEGGPESAAGLDGVAMAARLYEGIFLPFLKLTAYLAVGVLFFILAGRVFTFLTSQDEGIRKKAVGMISRTVI
ncbi:MAG: hypothetical protein LBU27_00720 [Candidatus Peribacteria bacterium]|nr:hypothetical protein [Candidatus Peribacteria bacterium]